MADPLQEEQIFEPPEPDETFVDEPHADKPKKKRGRPPNNKKVDPEPSAAPAKKLGRPPKTPNLEKELQASLMPLAMLFRAFDEYCGQITVNQVPSIAKSLDEWAQSDPKIHALLTQSARGGGAFGVVVATAPIAMAVFRHHGPPAIQARRQQEAQQQDMQWAIDHGWNPETGVWEHGDPREQEQAAESDTEAPQPQPAWAGYMSPENQASSEHGESPFATAGVPSY